MLRVTVPVGSAELVSDDLWALGATAIEERAAGRGAVVLVGGFSSRASAVAAASTLAPRWPSVLEEVSDDSWLDGWRAEARPVRAGHHFVVTPAWVETADRSVANDDDDVVVRIDPGRAFGSGSHPTTRLVLAAVEHLVTPETAVLDVGCGSGVLAVAAAMLGASPVIAIDIDPAALPATVANAADNGVERVVQVSASPLADVARQFDVVLANLLAGTIAALADDLAARVGPGGTLVLSGLLDDRWSVTAAAFPAWSVTTVEVEDGWAAVSLRRADGAPASVRQTAEPFSQR